MNLWHEGGDVHQRPALTADLDCDIAIIGAGFTGLWTAYHLITRSPDARIVVIEKESVGFGASGRNGGWASALYPLSDSRVAEENGVESAKRLRRLLNSAVDEIGQICQREGIAADFTKGGSLTVARSKPQRIRLYKHLVDDLPWIPDIQWLEGHDVRGQVQMADAQAALFNPHCARIHPYKLVTGLARTLEAKGVRIYEKTPAITYTSGQVTTERGKITAETVVRATEAYTTQWGTSEQRRSVVPTFSLMVATEPIADELWSHIGLSKYETFTEACHLIVYGQRTADNRLAIGGRGAPYHFGSRIRSEDEQVERTFGMLRDLTREWFPVLSDTSFTHQWGGALGIARDWHPHVSYRNGIGTAGGYVGDGVTNSYLASGTLADLILGEQTDRTQLPWVQHQSPRWEPEPIRWLGINVALKLVTWADHEEKVTHRESLLARVVAPLLGNL